MTASRVPLELLRSRLYWTTRLAMPRLNRRVTASFSIPHFKRLDDEQG